jgi:sulfhydrogenase subunit gamma (sulfur reductase)
MIAPAPRASVVDSFRPETAELVERRPLTGQEMFFRFQAAGRPDLEYWPGQFMEVSVPGIGEAPISISSSPSRATGGTFEMVVRRAGSVTRALHALAPGDRVGVRGPYGTHFPVEGAWRGHDLLFVCGGIGLVPVRSAIQYVLDHRADYGGVTILCGTRRPEDRLFTDELLEWKRRPDARCLETVDAADPSWGGHVGVITSLFEHLPVNAGRAVAVICGPPIMYKFVLLELRKLGIENDRIYLSLERHMKCALGKCGHCQINGLYACQDGPVFNYAALSGVREAI